MYTKEEIIDEILQIREEIGHEQVDVEIKDIYYENDELTIITPDRPEKSIIIGKGGWVVGKLREKLGIKSIHVISYTDIILKEYQLKLSVKHTKKLLTENKIPSEYIEENINREHYPKAKALVALSGGVDSSFSTTLAKALGFNVKTITVDPGTIILPKQFKFNINNLTEKINVEHEYIPTNMSEIIEDALSGKIHPCGRCSKNIHGKIETQLEKEKCKVMIFGDLLSTGSQSIVVNHENMKINLPALFRMEKSEIKNIITSGRIWMSINSTSS